MKKIKKAPIYAAGILVSVIAASALVVMATTSTNPLISPTSTKPTISPNSDLINKSWDQMTKLKKYRVECTVTAGPTTSTGTFTDEEKKNITLFEKMLAKYKTSEIDNILLAEKKLDFQRQKVAVVAGYNAYATGQASYEDALAYVENPPSVTGKMISTPQGLFYSGYEIPPSIIPPSIIPPSIMPGMDKTWKTFKDTALSNSMLKSAGKPITAAYDKSSLKFFKWVTEGKTRLAQYTAVNTLENSQTLVAPLVSAASLKAQPAATSNIYVDEKTREWKKVETLAQVNMGGVIFPVKQTCVLSYGSAVKVTVPAKEIKSMGAEAGKNELINLVQSLL